MSFAPGTNIEAVDYNNLETRIQTECLRRQATEDLTTRRTLPINITANTSNYNLYNVVSVDPLYRPGITDVVVTINSGVVVNSTTTPAAAFSVPSQFHPLDTVVIENNGTIRGRGGSGGQGGGTIVSTPPTPGGPKSPPTPGINMVIGTNGASGSSGGTGLSVARPVTVDNNTGTIAGGGGGGGGGGGAHRTTPMPIPKGWPIGIIYWGTRGGGGGGGAGNGAGGSGGVNGAAGTATLGGGAGSGTSLPSPAGTVVSGAGGAGGGLGSAGTAGNPSPPSPSMSSFTGGGSGGAGAAVSGNPLITWIAPGTIIGPTI